jgi:hypothetical protein
MWDGGIDMVSKIFFAASIFAYQEEGLGSSSLIGCKPVRVPSMGKEGTLDASP